MNLPSKIVRRLPGNLKEFQSTASHDGNISSVDCCVARKISYESGRRQKLGGASYDTFSVQYQKNNFYLANESLEANLREIIPSQVAGECYTAVEVGQKLCLR